MGGREGDKMKNKEKNALLRAFVDTEERLYLAVRGAERYRFAWWNEETGTIELGDEVTVEGKRYLPLTPHAGKNGKKIPVGYPTEEIMDTEIPETEELFTDIKTHLRKYMDLDDDDIELVTFFILSTWFYLKSDTVAYLRFIGDSGKGKSRMLTVVGDLCFYPLMVGGTATRSAIMRIQELYHGTLVLDEADFAGDKENEMAKYINTGFERRKVAIITNKNDPSKVEIFDAFSPKIFAMREPFRDSATEGRLLSIKPYETTRTEIPPVLPRSYYDEVIELRNRIAAWTLKNWSSVHGEVLDIIQMLPVEPRLKQLAAPLSTILPMFGEGMGNKFLSWIMRRQRKIAEERANSAEGAIFNAIVDIAKGVITPKDLPQKYEKYVTYYYTETSDDEGAIAAITVGMLSEITGMSTRRISSILSELGFVVERRTREVNGTKMRGRFVYVENTRRWVEAWRKYRAGESIIEVPEILRSTSRKYDPVIEHIRNANSVELAMLSQELGAGKNSVLCRVVDDFLMYSELLGKDLLLYAGAELKCPEPLARELESAGKVKILEEIE